VAQIRLIVGLGNPGSEYEASRHNAGFWLADALAADLHASFSANARLHGLAAQGDVGSSAVRLLKPGTFMNRSGLSVSATLRYFDIAPDEMLVAHDDLDLPPGAVRLKFDGGHGGQNGLRDIFSHLGHGRFHRLRIGIGHPGHRDRVTPWVLGRPNRDDAVLIERAVDDAVAEMPAIVAGDFEAAMRRLHTSRE